MTKLKEKLETGSQSLDGNQECQLGDTDTGTHRYISSFTEAILSQTSGFTIYNCSEFFSSL